MGTCRLLDSANIRISFNVISWQMTVWVLCLLYETPGPAFPSGSISMLGFFCWVSRCCVWMWWVQVTRRPAVPLPSAVSPGKAIASRRTVNGAWRVVNTGDQNEPRIVYLAVCWMLLNIIFSATFCPLEASLRSTRVFVYFLSFELNYCWWFLEMKGNCWVCSKRWPHWGGGTTLFSDSTQLTLSWFKKNQNNMLE